MTDKTFSVQYEHQPINAKKQKQKMYVQIVSFINKRKTRKVFHPNTFTYEITLNDSATPDGAR